MIGSAAAPAVAVSSLDGSANLDPAGADTLEAIGSSGDFAETTTQSSEIEYSNFTTSQDTVYFGTSVRFSATVTNNGSSQQDVSVPFRRNDEVVKTRPITLNASETTRISFSLFSTPGTDEYSIGTAGPESVTIRPAWYQFQNDPGRLGTLPGTSAPTSPIVEEWNASLNGGSAESFDSSPAVVNGTVYVGSPGGSVIAYNQSTGDEIWSYPTSSPVHASPSVSNGTVYIGSDDGTLYAIDATSGAEQWSASLTGEISASAEAGVASDLIVGTENGTVYRVDNQGNVVWRFQAGDAIRSSVASGVGSVFISSDDGNVYALDPQTGTEKWNFSVSTGSEVEATPTVDLGDRTLYVGSVYYEETSDGTATSSGTLYAVNTTNGAERWSTSIGAPITSSAALVPGMDRLYVSAGSASGTMYGFNATTGAQIWATATKSEIESAPVTAPPGVVIAGTAAGNVTAFNMTSGDVHWTYTTGGAVESTPALLDETVYVGSNDGQLYALGGSDDTTDSDGGGDSGSGELVDGPGAPNITEFEVEVEGTRTVEVSFDSNETLKNLSVRITDPSTGNTVDTLTEAEFDSYDSSYFNERTFDQPGTYRYELINASDADGNNGASGQNATVTLVTKSVDISHVSGPEITDTENLSANVYLTRGSGGLLQVQLRDETDEYADIANRSNLSELGITANTTLRINVTVKNWTPQLLLGAGQNTTWETTAVGSNTTNITIYTQPTNVQYNESQLEGSDKPWSETDTADFGSNVTVDMAISDLGYLSENKRSQLSGASLMTDAQEFGTPQYNPTAETLGLYVAAPGTNVNGNPNQGFFDAVLPWALLDTWNVSDPSELNVTAIGETAEPATTATTNKGIRINVPIGYSAGQVTVSPESSSTTDTTPPLITDAQVVDLTDGDGNVSDGDTVQLAVNASDNGTGVADVAADASAFGAGPVSLTDSDGDGRYNATFTVDSTSAASPGQYAISITAEDGAGNQNETTTDRLTLYELSTAVSIVPTSDIGNTATPHTVVEETTTVDIRVQNATGGVGEWSLTVNQIGTGTDVVNITDATVHGTPSDQNVAIAADNNSITIDAAGADTNNTGAVTLATVTLKGEHVGRAMLEVNVTSLRTESGSNYSITSTENGQLVVTPPKVNADYSGPPNDLNGDGKFEDVNGDGQFNIIDVQALYASRSKAVVKEYAAAFDYNNQSGVDIVDVQRLYYEQKQN